MISFGLSATASLSATVGLSVTVSVLSATVGAESQAWCFFLLVFLCLTENSSEMGLGIEMGLFGSIYSGALVTKCFRHDCPLLATNFGFVTKGA